LCWTRTRINLARDLNKRTLPAAGELDLDALVDELGQVQHRLLAARLHKPGKELARIRWIRNSNLPLLNEEGNRSIDSIRALLTIPKRLARSDLTTTNQSTSETFKEGTKKEDRKNTAWCRIRRRRRQRRRWLTGVGKEGGGRRCGGVAAVCCSFLLLFCFSFFFSLSPYCFFFQKKMCWACSLGRGPRLRPMTCSFPCTLLSSF
jgi:hypothetical protein